MAVVVRRMASVVARELFEFFWRRVWVLLLLYLDERLYLSSLL